MTPAVLAAAYLSRSLATNGGELVHGCDAHNARSNPLGGCRRVGPIGEPSQSIGRTAARAAAPEEAFVRSGEAFGGSGFRRTGEATGMGGVCARKAENEGTEIFTGEACFWRVEGAAERPGSTGAPLRLKRSMARAQGLDKAMARTIIR